MTDPPRLEVAQRLAATDQYWRAYLDGLNDKHHVLEPPDTPGASSCPEGTQP